MADSVKASTQGLETVDLARRRKGWNKLAKVWYEAALTSKATLKRFWAREAINRETFIRICETAGLISWEDIVEHYQTPRIPLDPDFVGREDAIAHLNALVNQGAKIIVIQGEGGIGKTKLARRYFKIHGFDFLVLWMPTEPHHIISVESLVEEWLRRDFHEEPGRELWINLQRLKRKLQNQEKKICILIDNLESALDKNGRLIKSLRSYFYLLQTLADPSVNSLTLITSRERLCESGIDVNSYTLKGLDSQAWKQFFSSRKINSDSPTLSEMCKAYGGNAKAMKIISGAVITDFEKNIDAYWNSTKDDLLIERELENLVVSQFNRLKKIDPEAYCLLYRLGCYRYQDEDVPFVNFKGILCLLWDVPESQRRRVLNRLCDRYLVECRKGKHWLHPVILTEAIARLQNSRDLELAHRQAADYWTNSIETINHTADALKALQAYHHYVAIADFEKAADIIIKSRVNQWGTQESLARSFYKRGLLEQLERAITCILNKLNPSYRTAKLYRILGKISFISGNLYLAIKYCEQSHQLVKYCLQRIPPTNTETINKLKFMEINCLSTIGTSQIGLWELEAAEKTLIQVIQLAKKIDYDKYAPSGLFYLAYLNSYQGNKHKACKIANYLYNRLPEQGIPSWGTEYRLYYLSLTYKSLGEIDKSLKLLQRIMSNNDNPYTQAKNKAKCGLAQLYREKGKYLQALSFHEQAIETFGEIGARYDLAEAYFQRALTYKKIGAIAKSRDDFDKAINLFKEMRAIKQVEKIKLTMGNL